MKTKYLFILFALGACTASRDQSTQRVIDTVAFNDSIHTIFVVDSIKKVKGLDALGRYIAGLQQRDSNIFAVLEKEPAWKTFKAAMDSNWNSTYEQRLSKMEQWQPENLSSKLNDTLKIFYPFSGPDFLHAFYLYPDADQYILSALEPIHSAPGLDTLSSAYRALFLDSLRSSLSDVFSKSFFITGAMKEDLITIQGVLPTLYFFIERSGHELVDQRFMYLDSNGMEVPVLRVDTSLHKIHSAKIIFRDRQSLQVKQLHYFSVNLSDPVLRETPEFERFIARQGPYNTFIKSASYCMHQNNFEYIKEIILANSSSLFQDDTGVPYRNIKNRLDWNIQLYGEYTVPVIAFRDLRFQKDLDSAYRVSATKAPLPFSMGYHWVSKKQNYMLVKKSLVSTPR